MAMKQHKLILLCRPARRRSTLKVLMASSALIAAGVTGAQAQTWNVDANGNWGTPSNWSPQTVPVSGGAAILGDKITADRTITLDAPVQLNVLNFLNPAHSYTLAPASGANTLTFVSGGSVPTLKSTATVNQTIDANVVLNKTLDANIGASGDMTITGGVSGGGGLTKTGAGALILSGPGAYTGFTAVNAGTLRAGAANAFSPTSATTVAPGATLDLNGFNQAVRTLAGDGNITLGSANLTINEGATTFSGKISGDGGSLTKAGSGITMLTGANSYTGGTTVSGGMLQVGIANFGGAIIGPATIDNGATLILFCNNGGEGEKGSYNGSPPGSGSFSGAIKNNGTLQTAGHGTLTF